MKRRTFIKNSLLASGVAAMPHIRNYATPLSHTDTPQEGVFKKSIMWGNIQLKGSILDKLKAAKDAGFAGIEPYSHLNREEVIDALKATGLTASSVCCSTHGDKPFSDPDPVIREEGFEGMRIAMEDAKAYGTDVVLLVPGRVTENVRYDECWERSTEYIRKLLPAAEKLKVRICIENVWNKFLLSPLEACRYVDQFNSPHVGFYFDCGNIMVFGWPEQWIHILGHRIGRIHVKEYSRKIGEEQNSIKGFDVALTEGDVNWAAILKEARKSYRGQWFTTEQGHCQTPEELADLSKRLDKVLES
ncbi:MAG: sugar phosphate isomerase/epimerase [Tannerellaceae bacterium]|jgi:hexulose-6-phosphate isomerase|nr:sugar phosphate isomerase/epimerase [Tannerellaceae bacterium]